MLTFRLKESNIIKNARKKLNSIVKIYIWIISLKSFKVCKFLTVTSDITFKKLEQLFGIGVV